MTSDVRVALEKALFGDTASIDLLVDEDATALAAADLETLSIGSRAVARVIDDYANGRISQSAARRWATWVRVGYVPGTGTLPEHPLDIEWPEESDDAIAGAVMRLSELGDVVDGELRPGEADQLIAELRQ